MAFLTGRGPRIRVPGGASNGIGDGVIATGLAGSVTLGPGATANLPLDTIVVGPGWTIDGSGALVVPADGIYWLMVRVGFFMVGSSGFTTGFVTIAGAYTGTPIVTVPLNPNGVYENDLSNLADFMVLHAGDTILPMVGVDAGGMGTVGVAAWRVKLIYFGPTTNLPAGG